MAKLSGEWRSYYRYPSKGRGDDFWGQHVLHATQAGNRLTLESGPEAASHVLLELEVEDDGKTINGVWAEDTDPKGYYKGRKYEGTIKLRMTESGERMNGIWHGAGRDGTMHTDIWELAKSGSPIRKDEMPKQWKLTHWYPSVDDGKEEFEAHDMKSYWRDDTLVLESKPKDDGSYMLARLHIQDNIATGNWYETTAITTGKNRGVQYSGAGQLLVDPHTHRMEGLWAGAGFNYELKKLQIYTGRWEIVPLNKV